ncbi:MAG: phosphatidate cytidylyltransferase [Burkholderiaceae bacterium]
MLLQRVLTAVALLLVLLPTILLAPPLAWGVVSLAFVAVAAAEWARLLPRPASAPTLAGLLLLAGLAWLFLPRPTWAAPALCAIALVWWVGFGVAALARVRAGDGGAPVAGLLVFACWLALYELRQLGPVALLGAMAIVWVADIGAYFVGRAVGRRKLAPRISPGKSWEGAIGGAFLVVIVAWTLAAAPALADSLPAVLVGKLGPWVAGVVLVGFVALSVVGDLHESLLKRQAGVKDSGRSLPGHGGVLDRVDALIPTMPLAALLHLLLQ